MENEACCGPQISLEGIRVGSSCGGGTLTRAQVNCRDTTSIAMVRGGQLECKSRHCPCNVRHSEEGQTNRSISGVLVQLQSRSI